HDSRLIRSVALSLRHREFTRHAFFSGMRTRQILIREHLPYVMPIVGRLMSENPSTESVTSRTIAQIRLFIVVKKTIGM
ncbi:ABC transporter permease, partial [Rhizobium ruizarguesonis]